MRTQYDFLIIGGGSAGLTAADFAVRLGLRVALVEKSRPGGDCTWTGCVPSKTLLRIARTAHELRTAPQSGISAGPPKVDFPAVMSKVREVMEGIALAESAEELRSQGIDVFLGEARFLDPNTIVTADAELKARRILIATGAGPLIPPIPGLDQVGYLTYETIWDLEALPEHLLVVGGGPIGCELAQAFRRLGSRVSLVEAAPRILLQDEPEASSLILDELANEGVEFHLDAPVEKIEKNDQNSSRIKLTTSQGPVSGDALLLTVGRRARLSGLELERAGVDYGPNGIKVNRSLRTSQRHIYAAGDCLGGFQFTHYAGWQGFMAVRNALLPGSTRAVLDRVPWTTFTDPEVAHVGLTEQQARDRYGHRIEVTNWPMARVDRALTDGASAGFIKLVHQPNGKLLGATVVSQRAGEMIHEWTLALDQGRKVGDLADSIHVYPTYSMANMQVSSQLRVSGLLSGASGRIIRKLVRLMR